MKKITSFLMMTALCTTAIFAQETVETELPVNKMVQLGTAQAEMVPGKWYFLQNPRDGQNNDHSYFALPGEKPVRGGLVEERENGIGLSTTAILDAASADEGVSSESYKSRMVRFVEVEGQEGAYSIQFGTGRWFGDGDPLNTKTVSNNQYLGGVAGKWNFYLVKNADGNPNEAGRFAWNKYNMQNRVDNNGVGNSVNFWNSGELTLSSLDWNQVADQGDAGIIGNNIWQIYDILVVGELDLFNDAWVKLLEKYNTITQLESGQFIDNLRNKTNVGTTPGNYREEDVDAFLAIFDQVDELMYEVEMSGTEILSEKFETVEEFEAYTQAFIDAYNAVINNKFPIAVNNLTPGYYTINSMLNWVETKKDTLFYTQEEADSVNAEMGYTEGDEAFAVAGGIKEIISSEVPAPIKSLSSMDSSGEGWVRWRNLEPTTEFLWKIETVEGKPSQYRLINMYRGHSFTTIGTSANSKLVASDTASVCFDYAGTGTAPVTGENVTIYNIRSSTQAQGGYYYIHAGGHSAGKGTSGWAVGWEGSADASKWYLAPVDEATADQWINGPEAQLAAQFQKADSIIGAFPAQLAIAKDMVAEMNTEVNVANADNFFSPYHCPAEGSIAGAFDDNASTFWHSNWQSGNDYAYSTTMGTNFFVIEDSEGLINGGLAVVFTRRNVQNDHLKQLVVYGSNDAYDLDADLASIKGGGEPLGEWTELGALDFPYNANNETVTSNAIEFEGQYQYYKFVCTATSSSRGYFHIAEFKLYPATISQRYETTQYIARKAQADALQAAIDAWTAAEFPADSVGLLTDEAYVTAYNNLLAAAEAWGAVFVDPAELRDAIAGAPASNLFVIGNNPGQWKEGVVTPATAVEAAQAYDASGEYNPATSQAHIDAIDHAIENVYNNANPIETGKWYRIKFPTEEMYEEYNWDKTGAQSVMNTTADVQTSPELFGKKLATGLSVTTYADYVDADGNPQLATQYNVEMTEESFEGDGLFFFDSEEEFENGEDLFRFIETSDSTFMLQNKATGLFLRSGYPVTLSAIPSYFQHYAIGAGANLLRASSVVGANEPGYLYLHAQRADNRLTTWASTNLASNSMLMIEEAEAVEEAPATAYTTKLWPGKVYTYTMPVDVKVGEGATAYAASLNEEGTEVTLYNLSAYETIAHGTPFIMIAESEGEYESTSDMYDRLRAEKREELGVESLDARQTLECQNAVNECYVFVSMDHGMEVDTLVHDMMGLKGTMRSYAGKAGQMVVAKENGFIHTLADNQAAVAAFSAYFATDFDPEGDVVLNKITIAISEDGVDTGINEVLNKVAQNGNIYNAAGQLVGKGNINTVNNLPAGIYVVNGVKVTKK